MRKTLTMLLAATLATQPALAAERKAAAAEAERPLPSAIGYTPQDDDERGIWMEVNELERKYKDNKLIVRDPALNTYVRGVLCKTVGDDKCGAARIYIVNTPQFNAGMYPTGMMVVNTGLMLRMRDEAQFAAVLGHEFAHFEKQHTLRMFKKMRADTDAMMWMSFLVGALALLATLDSIFSFSRDMETEADMESLAYLQKSPYSTDSAYKIWEHLRAEQDATALARKQKSRKDKNGGFFATHPNSGERMAYLKTRSEAVVNPDGSTHSDSFRAAMQAWWPKLVDDQVKLNDFGGSEYLLDAIAAGQWTPDLLYARGELYRSRGQAGDMEAAAGFYRQAIEGGSQLPETWRGLGLAEIRAGRNDEGRAALREYLARKPEAGDKGIISMMIGG